jgi:hypothetical protein
MNRTERRLIELLGTPTGTHFLDSGGKEGRHWQRNKGRKWLDDPQIELSFSARPEYIGVGNLGGLRERNWNAPMKLDITASLNVFHHLCRSVEVTEQSAKLNYALKNFARRKEWRDEGWMDIVSEWLLDLTQNFRYKQKGATWVNTYNGECALSQVLQFTTFMFEQRSYVALQIHQGADVRGGYTSPYIFEELDMLYSYNDMCIRGGVKTAAGQITIEGHVEVGQSHNWTTDDTYHWYYDGSTNSGTQLQDYEATEDEDERGQGKVYVDKNGNGYCPFTGEQLTAEL